MKKLFDKHSHPNCSHCKHSEKYNTGELLCAKRGIVGTYASCKAFVYDPLKRRPVRPPALKKPEVMEKF